MPASSTGLPASTTDGRTLIPTDGGAAGLRSAVGPLGPGSPATGTGAAYDGTATAAATSVVTHHVVSRPTAHPRAGRTGPGSPIVRAAGAG